MSALECSDLSELCRREEGKWKNRGIKLPPCKGCVKPQHSTERIEPYLG